MQTSFPRSTLWSAPILGVLALAACGDDTYICTSELRSAVSVKVSSKEGFQVDRVTAKHKVENECHLVDDRYACSEQGGGTYLVRVYSGSQTWTRSVHVDADHCHVLYPAESLAIELTAATAD